MTKQQRIKQLTAQIEAEALSNGRTHKLAMMLASLNQCIHSTNGIKPNSEQGVVISSQPTKLTDKQISDLDNAARKHGGRIVR